VLIFFTSCHLLNTATNDCKLQNIKIVSADLSRNDIYYGRGGNYEVQFRNENAPNPADNFPDPLVTVKNTTAGESCDIKDASGIWAGESVYLDTKQRVLLMNEYSGSSDTLVFYDLTSCRKLDEYDVSGKRWEIAFDKIRIGQECQGDDVNTCRHLDEIHLNSRCLMDATNSMKIK
jgi:hypothetical protein